MAKSQITFVSVLMGLAASPAWCGDLDVSGHWLTADHSSTVEIRDCGDGTPCGVVVAVDPHKGGLEVDHHNRSKDLKGRAMIGATVLAGFQGDGEAWHAGHIYNPHDGRTYRASLHLMSKDRLAVSGCLGPICKKLIWERVAQGDGATIARTEQASLR